MVLFALPVLSQWHGIPTTDSNNLLASMCLSAQLNINSTANPSSVYLAVLSQPYATHQTERGDTEGMVSNPTPQGANRSEKQRWIPPSFLSP